jgi:hypothetical protein
MKYGGKVKMAKGGMLKKPDNSGLKKLPEEVRNKMGYMKKGGTVKKGMHMMPDGTMMKDSEHKGMKKPATKKMKSGGMVKKCKRDGICKKGKTKGRMV